MLLNLLRSPPDRRRANAAGPWEKRRGLRINSLFAWLISHQPAVLFSQNKPATSNQPTVLLSQNESAPAISHQPTEQAESCKDYGRRCLPHPSLPGKEKW
jgi:hypothetical protein